MSHFSKSVLTFTPEVMNLVQFFFVHVANSVGQVTFKIEYYRLLVAVILK